MTEKKVKCYPHPTCGTEMYGRVKAVEAYYNNSDYPSAELILEMLNFTDKTVFDENEQLKNAVDSLCGENIALKKELKELKAELDRVKTTEETVNSFVEGE